MTEWIDVHAELPKSGLVLLKNKRGDITVGSHKINNDGGAWRIGNYYVAWDYDCNYDYVVTHWRNIPE
jgi:hypothetical protein